VTGTVTDGSTGETLPGVNIRVVGTQIGTTTGADGAYQIAVPGENATLRFSFVGFNTETVSLNGRTTVDVPLQPSTLTGQEVVVVGYSRQQRADLTGSVDVVDTESLQDIPEPQLTDQLQGMASGLTVIGSGQPGKDPQIRIRGINTFGNNKPLFVVDGVPTQTIENLNPGNVESIQVLKDASAASIYGARASNGVVIVETKQGEGDMTVQVNSYAGVSRQPDTTPWDIASPQQRAQLEWMAFRNSGLDPSDPQYGSGEEPRLPDFLLPVGAMEGDPGTDPSNYFLVPRYTDPSQLGRFTQIVRANKAGTNWFDEVMQTAPQTKTDLTVSGGGDQGSYLLSVGYLNEQGTMRETYLQRYNFRSNATYTVNDHIRVGENLAYTVEQNQLGDELSEGGGLGMSMRMRPIVPVRDIRGNWAGSKGNGLGNPENPVAIRERTVNDNSVDKRLFGNAFVEVSFLDDFRLRTSFGGELNSGRFEDFFFPTYENRENVTTDSYSEGAWNNQEWTLSNTLNYDNTFGERHNVTVLAGAEWNKDVGRFQQGSTTDFFSFDPDFTNLQNGAGTPVQFSSHFVASLASQFGKVDYNYAGRYFVSGTLRRDGSSKFLRDRYGVFPSVSAGWRISEEPFFPENEWLTDLKVRAGWGIMGNQLNVGQNNAYSLFTSTNQVAAYPVTGSNSSGTVGFFPSRVGAPEAKWEEDENLNVGVDLALLDGQVEATVDYYQKDITDLLFNPEIPGTGGTAAEPTVNVASMRNTGVDASLRGQTQVGGLEVRGSLNVTSYNNEITRVSGVQDFFSQESRRFQGQNIVRNEVGQEMSSYYGFNVIGFWQSEQEIQEANAGVADGEYQPDAAPGRFRYEDVNGDGQITTDDRTFLGSPNPNFTAGLNLGLAYSSWDLSVALYGSQGAELWNQVKWWHDFFGSFNGAKSTEALTNSWRPGADNSDATVPVQELGRSFSTNAVPNSYFVEDGDYLRIRNVRLGYSVPSALVQRIGAEQIRLYVQVTNLATFSPYSNAEPEIGSDDPGDVTSFGIDEGAFPRPREYLGGVNIQF
jgi:TonB-linked SusC/RagA family outer membrane protein